MATGRVKWFDCRKGYGFIVDEAGQDVFVHYTVIETEGFRRLRDGALVEFEVGAGPRGLCATRARPMPVDAGARGPVVESGLQT